MLGKLLMYALSAEAFTDEFTVTVHNVFRIIQAVQTLGSAGCREFDVCCTGFTHLGIRLCITREPGIVCRCTHCCSPNGNTRFTKTLHCCKCDNKTCFFCSERCTAGTSFTTANAACNRNTFGCPFFCQRTDTACRDSSLFACPFAGLWNAVFFAKDIFFEVFKSFGSVFYIEMIISIIDDPLICDRTCEGGISARTRCKPGSIHDCVGVVVERIDEDALHAHFLQPYTPDVRLLSGIDTVCGVRIVGPEHDHVSVLKCIRKKVELLRLSETP